MINPYVAVFLATQSIALIGLLWRMGTAIKVLEAEVAYIKENHLRHLQEQIDELYKHFLKK